MRQTREQENRYRANATKKILAARARTAAVLREAADPACAYCGARPARRCPTGDGKTVIMRCADCWPKTVA
jgi:hypothetical protein